MIAVHVMIQMCSQNYDRCSGRSIKLYPHLEHSIPIALDSWFVPDCFTKPRMLPISRNMPPTDVIHVNLIHAAYTRAEAFSNEFCISDEEHVLMVLWILNDKLPFARARPRGECMESRRGNRRLPRRDLRWEDDNLMVE